MKLRTITSAIAVLFMSAASLAQTLTVSDVTSRQFIPRTVSGVTPLDGTDSYTQLSSDGKRITQHSFRTGKEEQVLFDVATARNAKFESIDGYKISPNGQNILLQTETHPIYRHSNTARWYIFNVRNNKVAPLSDGGPQQAPVWSPDGKQVAFVRDGNIFLVKLMYDNAEVQVTTDGKRNSIINGIPDWVNEEEFASDCSMVFTADSEMLVWIRYDESAVPEFSFPWYKGLAPERMENVSYTGAYTYKYPKAGEQNSKVSVRSYDIKARTTKTLQIPLDADGYIPRVYATRQADKVAVMTLNRHQDVGRLYMANTRSTVAQMVIEEKADHYINDDMYSQLLITDSHIVFPSERTGYNHIYVYSLTGTQQRHIGQSSQIVTSLLGYDEQTQTVYYQAVGDKPGQRVICRTDAKGKTTRLSQPSTGQASAILSSACNYYMQYWSDLYTPLQVTLHQSSGAKTATLEENKELAQRYKALPQVTFEQVMIPTEGGEQLCALIIKPADFNPGKRYPVVMQQYSGPGSQRVVDSWNVGSEFGRNAIFERLLCQEGFVCVFVDGRGTGYRGAAFEKCTYLRLGEKESRDQVMAARWLAQQSYVDAKRIGIWGWSFGGFNTIMSMEEGSGVFASGVAVAPVTSWRYYDTVYAERYMRTPQENPAGYDQVNCISRASQLQGDLLLIHGLADDNVHFQNTAEYTEALVQADKDFRQLTYTNRNHSIYGGNTRTHLVRQILNHFKQTLK